MTSRASRRTLDNEGFAIVAVLLVLIGLMGLAHGALLLAGRERIASALEARLEYRRLVARGATRLPPLSDTLPSLGALPRTLASGAHEPIRWAARASALGRELVLVTGAAELDHLPGEDRVGVVAWRLDPSQRVAAAGAVVESGAGAQLAGGTVEETGWLAPALGGGIGACADELRALDSLGARVPDPLGVLPLSELVSSESGVPGLGLLVGDTLLARIPQAFHVRGEVRPSFTMWGGTCVAEPSNWGSPSDPTGPCGGQMVTLASDHDLVVRGGEGQGVLIVRGSLLLTGGVQFKGVAIVGGDLTIDQGSALVGMARVRGSLRVHDAGRVQGSACAAARGMRAATVLRRPLTLPGSRVHPL